VTCDKLIVQNLPLVFNIVRVSHQHIQWWAWLGRSGHHDSLQAVDRQMLLLLSGGQVSL